MPKAATSKLTQFRDLLADAGIDALEDLNLDDESLKYETHDAAKMGMHPFVYVHDIPQLILHSLLDPEQHGKSYLFTGPSAIGKTDAVRQGFAEAARQMGRPGRFFEMHVSQMVISDVMGIPREERKVLLDQETGKPLLDPTTGEALTAGTKRTEFFPPVSFALESALPEHARAYDKFITHWREEGHADWSIMRDPLGEPFPLYGYFWDEVTNPSSPAVVHQCFSIWYGNFVAANKLVGDAFHVLAGNRVEDQTNSMNLARSACSRLCIIPAVASLAGWIANYAMQTVKIAGQETMRIHPAVITFLHNNSRYFAPSAADYPQMSSWPSPRTWDFVSRDLYSHDRSPLREDLLNAKIAGHVGVEPAKMFSTFLKHWERLVDVRKLLDSPQVGDGPFGWLPQQWPGDMDVRMMIALQMMTMVDEGNAKRFLHFLIDDQKFQPEMSVLIVKLMNQTGKMQQVSEQWAVMEFAQWAMKYKQFII